MNYSWTLITDLDKINEVIAFAEIEVKTYFNRSNNRDLDNINAAQYTAELVEKIADTEALLNSTIARIPNLAPGSRTYKKEVGLQKELESKLYNLQLASETSGEVDLISGQYNQNRNTVQLAEANKLLSEAQARKAAIEAGN